MSREPAAEPRLTHASWFSGAGGTDLGLEAAGWRTVSVSEIEPYACAVLDERWPGIPNLGDISAIAAELRGDGAAHGLGQQPREHPARRALGSAADEPDGLRREDGPSGRQRPRVERGTGAHAGERRSNAGGDTARSSEWLGATLYSGGFPCQDLSVAGARRGLAGERSGLAFAFLDVIGSDAVRRAGGARYVLLENVPGLLSSHAGRDMAAILGALVDLGYGVGYRLLDGSLFGVPQRRRRIFILGVRRDPHDTDGRAAAERAAQILAIGHRCRRHPAPGIEAGPEPPTSPRAAADRGEILRQAVNAKWHKGTSGPAGDEHHNLTAAGGEKVHASRGREADGLARRPHDREDMEAPQVATYVKARRAQSEDDPETWTDGDHAPTLNDHDNKSDTRATMLAFNIDPENGQGSDLKARPTDLAAQISATDGERQTDRGTRVATAVDTDDDPLLPEGLDSHRFRLAGNGVIAPVAEWIGQRIREDYERHGGA